MLKGFAFTEKWIIIVFVLLIVLFYHNYKRLSVFVCLSVCISNGLTDKFSTIQVALKFIIIVGLNLLIEGIITRKIFLFVKIN